MKAGNYAHFKQGEYSAIENDILTWIKSTYIPIDKLLGEIINPFPKKISELSADPYDDNLMYSFCEYLKICDKKIKRINIIFTSNSTPKPIRNFGLDLYHCFSQVQDALKEFERYTMGYVDNYLHDGNEMIRHAKKIRSKLKSSKNNLLAC